VTPCPHDRYRDVEACLTCEAEEERDAARAEMARLEAIQRDLQLYRDAAEKERDEARAENERLRAEVEDLKKERDYHEHWAWKNREELRRRGG